MWYRGRKSGVRQTSPPQYGAGVSRGSVMDDTSRCALPSPVEENSIFRSKKRALAVEGNRATVRPRSGIAAGAGTTVVRRPGSRTPAVKIMNMKFCPNYGCVAYGRVVYTQSTRCVFCRWDLKPPRMKSETVDTGPTSTENAEGWGGAPAGTWTAGSAEVADVPQSRVNHRRRASLRHSA